MASSVALPRGPQIGEGMAPSPGWWTAASPQTTSATAAATYGASWGAISTTHSHGPGPDASTTVGWNLDSLECFLSFLQSGHASFPASWPTMGREGATSSSKAKTVINIDAGEDVRIEKRLTWTADEDVRLVSAWLHNSNDPINGNCKKTDQYWGDVHAEYNMTTPANRKRKVKHIKDRFQKIKRWVGFFCGSWKKATSIYASGQSDDQLRDKAMKFYLDDYTEGSFTVMHCWKIFRDEPKWHVILEDIENQKKGSWVRRGKWGAARTCLEIQ